MLALRTRRWLLGAGAAGAAAVVAVAVALPGAGAARRAPDCPSTPAAVIHDGFHEPPERRSHDGVLSLTLRAEPGRTYISHAGVRSSGLFNRSYPGPTLRVCPGDLLRIKLVNHLRRPTNLHLHGMHVSPRDPGDDVLISIPPGGSHQYSYRIPDDQVPGTYWYHPHRHMFTNPEVFSGMAGALIVEGDYDDVPGLAGIGQRTLVIQENQLRHGHVVNPDTAGNGKVRMLVNGRRHPRITIRPGELQRWRIVNADADRFLRLRLAGRAMILLARDGNPQPRPSRRRTLVLAPGARREVLVRGRPGRTQLRTLFFDQHFVNTRRQNLASLVTTGARVTGDRLPGRLEPEPDLRRAHVDRHRVIRFRSAFPRFLINGKTFSHHRVDQTMKLGATEQWRLVNVSSEWHTFHIHINPFQVIKVNDKPVHGIDYQDDVPLPPHGSVTMRTVFAQFTGKFVFHCHILAHEDGGMMSLVQVVR